MPVRAGFLWCVLALGGRAASAQVAALPERTVTGVVVDSVSGRPLSGAILYFDFGAAEHRSGGDGRFRIEELAPRDTLLIVRRIGYVPRPVAIPYSLSAQQVDVGTVLLRPVATELDKIAVEAEEVRIFPHLEDFYRRKQERLPGGTYVTREDILRSGVRRTSELLQRNPRMEIKCPNVRLGDDACEAQNRRARNNVFSGDFGKCEMELYIDGHRATQRPDEVPVGFIAGLEIYSGPATTPSAFGNGRCGVIAIWTTRGGGT
jgi:hypothetical protein